MRVGRVRIVVGFRRVVIDAVGVVDFVGAGEDVAVVERVGAPTPLAAAAAADYAPYLHFLCHPAVRLPYLHSYRPGYPCLPYLLDYLAPGTSSA